MTPEEWKLFLENLRALGSRPGLCRIRQLLELVGHPERGLCVIHITGTNGKGSCGRAMYAGLLSLGLAAGHFSSPELFSVNERVSARGREITDAELLSAAGEVRPAWERLAAAGDPPTEFEFFVALALVHFRAAGVTHAVIEVGMGGAKDATNVFSDTALCVFTPISLDHTRFLGGTVAEIAREKSGILRPGCAAVTVAEQEGEALSELARAASAVGTELRLTAPETVRDAEYAADHTAFTYRGERIYLPLAGDFQVQNASLAAEALRVLSERRPEVRYPEALRGFCNARLHGRFERVACAPDVYLDAGHNPAGNAALLAAIDRHLAGRPLVLVMAMYRDKDYPLCIRRLSARAAAFYATQSASPRALPADEVAAVAAPLCAETVAVEDPAEAARRARDRAREVGGAVVICGSFGHLARAMEGIR